MNRHTSIPGAPRFQSGGMAPKLQTSVPMTQHPADISRLPEHKERQLTPPSREVVDERFQMFSTAMAPLREGDNFGISFSSFINAPCDDHDVHGAIPLPP